MIEISLYIQGQLELDKIFLKLKKPWSQPEMVQAMSEVVDRLQMDAKFYAPHWHGDLRDSIMTEISDIEGDQIFGTVFTDSPYAVAQEQGVPAGYWMNWENMEEWVIDRWGFGGDVEPGEEDYAAMGGYGLALWLYRYGLHPKRFFEQALENNIMDIVRRFDASLVEIIE